MVLEKWAELPEKWGFEAVGAARILPLCASACPTAFLQTQNGWAAVRVGVVGKGGFARRRCRPKKTRRSRTELGAKFGFGNGQKMREILGFGGGTPNIYFLFILVVKIAPNRINDLGF